MRTLVKAAFLVPVAALLLATAADARGPSFSCRGYLHRPERLICNDSELSDLDWQVARLYRKLGGPNGADDDVRDYARDALQRRNDCTSARCIRRILRDEIDYLENQDSDNNGGY
ncbi:MAG: hypothetical protein JO167_06165 [Alphaproteobacteria bacterium]|nr:hypothetical protein [Alphaproteobacteria bacterium]